MAAPLPNAEIIDRALDVVRGHFAPSPLAGSGEVRWKLEQRLPTGAFKVRGALAAMCAARERGVDAVIAASAGNHGAGVAWAAQQLGMRATIFVPRDCPAIKRRKMEAGAEVVVCAVDGYDDTERIARETAIARGIPFLSPFDDTDVMAGNGGTMGRELQVQCPELRTIVVPVGGAGLLAGLIASYAASTAPPRFVAVQSEVSSAFAHSLASGEPQLVWPPAVSLAEGLEGGTGVTGVEASRSANVQAVVVPERAIARAMHRLHHQFGEPIEGSAAVVEAARALGLLTHLPTPMALVVTGGNVDPSVLAAGAAA